MEQTSETPAATEQPQPAPEKAQPTEKQKTAEQPQPEEAKKEEKAPPHQETKPREPRKHNLPENEILIGNEKEIGKYLHRASSLLLKGHKKLILKARGSAIKRAADVALIGTNRDWTGIEITSTKWTTESMTNKEGTSQNISAVEIVLEQT